MRKSGMFGGALKKLFILAMVLFPALANAQSLVNPTIVNPTINQKITAGNGFQATSVAGCTTPATAGSGCSVNLTWAVPFLDTSYDVVCSCLNSPQGAAFIGQLQPSLTGVAVFILTPTNVAESCSVVTCIGVHP